MWESDFGFQNRETANANIKVLLSEYEGSKYILVQVNGKSEKDERDESLSKEQLAVKPIKFTTTCGRHLCIGFNLKEAKLTLKHNGEDVERLPEVEKVLQVCRNKITNIQAADQRYVTLILISRLPRF